MGYSSWGCKESDMTEVHDTCTCYPGMTGNIRAHKLNLFTNLLSFNAEKPFKAFLKDLFQKEPSCAAGRNAKWCSHFDK